MKPKQADEATRALRTALKSLSDQSLKTSRRLDDTYYSILEKVSVLRQTIGSLQELSGLTKELHENFESDTTELVDDVQGQFDGFDNFDAQQQQILGLEDRIQVGKQKADSLTDRLAKAKERVDARAQAELEWETKNTRMLLPKLLLCSRHINMILQVAPAYSGEFWAS
jgi:chromosome segregation ATPase